MLFLFIFLFLFFRYRKDAFLPVNLLFTFFPYLVLATFLFVQKKQNGWYFFPYHIESITFSFEKTVAQFSKFFNFIFWSQGRYWWKNYLLVAGIIAVFTNRINKENYKQSILLLLLIFMFAFLLFSSLSFYMDRYVLVVLIAAAIIVGVSIVSILGNKFLIVIATAFLAIIAIEHFESEKFNNDSNMGYRRSVIALQQAIDFCAKKSTGNELVYGNFPGYYALNFPESGYLRKDKTFLPSMNFVDNLKYFILSEPGDYGIRIDENRYTYSLVATFKNGYSTTKVYELKRK